MAEAKTRPFQSFRLVERKVTRLSPRELDLTASSVLVESSTNLFRVPLTAYRGILRARAPVNACKYAATYTETGLTVCRMQPNRITYIHIYIIYTRVYTFLLYRLVRFVGRANRVGHATQKNPRTTPPAVIDPLIVSFHLEFGIV